MTRRLLRLLPLLLAAPVAAAAALLLWQPWADESAGGAPAEYRVCNLVYQLPPESSPWEANPVAVDLFNDGKPLLLIGAKYHRITTDPSTSERRRTRPSVTVDAETGEVLERRTFTPEDGAAVDELLATVRFEPFDPDTATWPYSDATTLPARRLASQNNNPSFRLPDPASGMVYTHISGGDGSERVRLSTCKSQAIIDLGSGEIVSEKTIHPDDAEAYNTFRAAIASELTS